MSNGINKTADKTIVTYIENKVKDRMDLLWLTLCLSLAVNMTAQTPFIWIYFEFPAHIDSKTGQTLDSIEAAVF